MSNSDAALSGPRALKPVGSPEWCWQTADLLKRYFYNIEQTWRQADEVVDDLREVAAWKIIPQGNPYGSFDRMCQELLGMRAKDVDKKIDREKIKAFGPHGTNQHTPGVRDTNSSHTENTTTILARLKRDDPDLAAAVIAGEITPNQAARQKGWRYPRIELRNPATVAARIRDNFTTEQIKQLIELLNDGQLF